MSIFTVTAVVIVDVVAFFFLLCFVFLIFDFLFLGLIEALVTDRVKPFVFFVFEIRNFGILCITLLQDCIGIENRFSVVTLHDYYLWMLVGLIRMRIYRSSKQNIYLLSPSREGAQ